MKLVQATVKGNPRQVTTKYGDRLVADCLIGDGEEVTIWRPAGDVELVGRCNGERVTLAVDSKGKYHLMESLSTGLVDPTDNQTNGNGHELGSCSKAPEIRDYVSRLAKLYHHCYRVVKDEFSSDGLETPQLKDVASCLFIQTIRKFDL